MCIRDRTESAANRYFDEEDPIGKVLTFSTPSSQQNFEVTGVIADMPVRSHQMCIRDRACVM